MKPKKIETVTTESQCKKGNWTKKLKINGKEVSFKLDTGAECNVLAEKSYRSLKTSSRLKASSCKLLTYSGHQMSPVGKATLICEYKGKSHELDFQIIDTNAPAILGRDS